MKNSPSTYKTMKTLALSIVFFLAYQISFAQTMADKKPYEAPALPSSVNPAATEHKVTIIKNSETVISSENNSTAKNIDGTGKTVYTKTAEPGVGEKVYISYENETPQAKPAPSNISVPIIVDTKQPK